MSSSNSPLPDPERIRQALQREPGTEPQLAGSKEEPPAIRRRPEYANMSVTPLELEAYLNRYVIGQANAVSMLATKIATHYNRMRLETERHDLPHIVGNIKPNVLLIGPTGVGKTYIVRLIADHIKVPFVKGDATKFSETGYVGGDVEDLVRELVRVAGGDIAAAERGIVYIDEIDKIAASPNVTGLDVSRSGVQRNLLKIMEETEVDMKVPHDIASQMEAVIEMQRSGKAERKIINTRNILFIVSGAFSQLDDIVRKRIRGGTIGFGKRGAEALDGDRWAEYLTAQDLVKYGFETEFIGRLPVLAKLQSLGVEELYQILRSPNSAVIEGKKRDFLAYGIELTFDDEALHMLAVEAAKEQTGARGILAVMERLLLPFEKNLPGQVTALHITPEMVVEPNEALTVMLLEAAMRRYQRELMIEHGIVVSFSGDAIDWLRSSANGLWSTVDRILHDRLQNYPYGLKLLGVTEFEMTAAALENPQQFLDESIKRNYAKKGKGEKNG